MSIDLGRRDAISCRNVQLERRAGRFGYLERGPHDEHFCVESDPMTLAGRKPPLHRSSRGCAVPDANTGREVNSDVGLARRIHVRKQHAEPGGNHA